MIREHAPLLAGTLDDLGHAAWLLTAVPGTGGEELRGIPRHSVHQAGAQNMPAIRYDWFEHAGMTESLGVGQDAISTFESKEGVVDVNPFHAPGHFFVSYHTISIPDLEEALERIVNLDPVGEGHTIGMTSSNRVGRPCYHRAWGILCQAHGVSSEPWWVHLDFYNHTSFPRRVYGYEGRDPEWPVPAYQEWERCHGPGGSTTPWPISWRERYSGKPESAA